MGISIRQLTRRYGAFAALDDVSLDIADGEFVALLGPSGSGKTTLLRILAGLDEPDRGEVWREGQDLLALPVQHRGVGLVFQHYALFPHMTVADNVAFGLRVRPRARRPSRREIDARVEALLRRVQLEDLGRRYPAQLSGGQRQRVALARALAVEPSLLLLDEPFGALDAQVRGTLRHWLRELQRSLGLTTVLVTHDQEEALELADRVVVMNHGHVEQIGSPAEIYREPATPFVHGFIGRANRVRGHVERDRLHLGGHAFAGELPAEFAGREVDAWLRPEHLALAARGSGGWSGRIEYLDQAGPLTRARLSMHGDGLSLDAEWSAADVAARSLAVGDVVSVHARQITLFESVGPQRRYRFVPTVSGQGAADAHPIDFSAWLHRKA
ncbi:ABC transporter ATP-binding protein [Dyella sp. BiH032]|uniref:sulfate/molybdate ABC transporter ATP-binding protein n=1 Tax=Dyella sp. BiH032 TaxID=3075430 RepID=UPI002892E529|nr:ABC transporter ATP-binding protein [Dyella sp. BiH032]WNL44477.1 ABC transporter ATP-binding protein [Dyella sp. BiH032]